MMHFIRVSSASDGRGFIHINVEKIHALRSSDGGRTTQIWFSGLEDDYFSCNETQNEIMQKIGKILPVDVAN